MKIFYVVSRFPLPIDKGDKLRAYHQIRLLKEYHQIYLFAINEGDLPEKKYLDQIKNLCERIRIVKLSKLRIILNLFRGLFNKIPFQVNYFYSKKISKILSAEIKNFNPDLVFFQLIRTAEYSKDSNQRRIAVDFVDVLSKGLHRRSEKSRLFLKYVFNLEYKRVLQYEKVISEIASRTMIITKQDKKDLPSAQNKVEVIPNGIDTKYFIPAETGKVYDFLFAGNMNYPPNVEAVIYFAEEIFPEILKHFKNAKFCIAGASPNKKVLALQSDSIIITGWVEDLRTYYNNSKIFVAPLKIGTGLQNKLLEAMAMKIPCITSSLAYNGLNADKDKNILVADTKEEFIIEISKLLTDQNLYRTISENARQFVIENYDWENIKYQLNDFFEKNF